MTLPTSTSLKAKFSIAKFSHEFVHQCFALLGIKNTPKQTGLQRHDENDSLLCIHLPLVFLPTTRKEGVFYETKVAVAKTKQKIDPKN